jgi:hypothetical protein
LLHSFKIHYSRYRRHANRLMANREHHQDYLIRK